MMSDIGGHAFCSVPSMNRTLLTDPPLIHHVDRTTADGQPVGAIMATDDHELIRDWARRHSAEPATGEATPSGPATVAVNDGGAGIRFNFPSAARFRPITWEEWFQNFHHHGLLFVYEREDQSGSYRLIPKHRVMTPIAATKATDAP